MVLAGAFHDESHLQSSKNAPTQRFSFSHKQEKGKREVGLVKMLVTGRVSNFTSLFQKKMAEILVSF